MDTSIRKVTNNYYNGKIKEVYHYKNDLIHNDDGPAVINYDLNGNITSEIYFINGVCHREKGPAKVNYFDKLYIIEEYYFKGHFHRIDGPAVIKRYSTGKVWYKAFYIHGQKIEVSNLKEFQTYQKILLIK